MYLKIIWTVKTLDSFPIQPGKSLLSSRFYADSYRETEFCFRIHGEFPRNGGDRVGSLFLCRCDNDGPEKVEYEYILNPTYGQGVGSTYKTQFLKPQHDASYWCFETDALPIMKGALSGGKLVVSCTFLSCKNDKYIRWLLGEREDFAHLSEAFAELFDKSLFSDAVIQIPRKEFKIHKAVLEVRCPALLKGLQTEETQGAYSQYDEDTLQAMLEYIYTGEIKSENFPDELYFLLKESNDSVFNHLSPILPYVMHVETTYNVKEIDFRWTIEDFLNFSQNKEWFHIITAGDAFTWFKLTFLTFQSEDKTKHLEFTMHKMSKTTTAFVKCSIVVHGTAGARTVFQGNYLFTDECSPWRVQLDHRISFISKRELSGRITFCILLQIASGVFVNSVKLVDYYPTACQNVSKRLHGLGHDIKKLYENQQHSDVILKVRNKRIPAHKAVLSARSAVFHQMLKTEKAEVDINNLDEKVALSMVYYIYSAQVINLNIDHAFELYKAANLYKISPLKSKCSKFLKSSIDEKNADKIQEFAEEQNDCELALSVYDFYMQIPQNCDLKN